jgi:hypothetical protein
MMLENHEKLQRTHRDRAISALHYRGRTGLAKRALP